MSVERPTVYFDFPGKHNTQAVVHAVTERLKSNGIQYVIVASSTGETGLKIVDALALFGTNVVVVTSHSGFEKEGECEMPADVKLELEKRGARVVRSSHALSGVERSLTRKLGGTSRIEAIAESLRALFGQGMKVCVEIAVMAADYGAIPVGEVEVISIGGYHEGADTACVVRPAHANAFFDFEVREIIAIPRSKRGQEGN